ncbi:MAG: redoxin domain-containing protein [Blastocatellia bacterium]|nr:redoxin domain-containing protein [Blastocatellia bacterium]
MKNWMYALLRGLCLVCSVQAVETKRAVVIYEDKASEVQAYTSLSTKPDDLWITLADLKRATGFVNKPQGVCRAELCFPLPKKRRTEFLQTQSKTTWFNLTEFARLLKQPVARDDERAAWYFGPRPEVQNSFTKSLAAPNFTLPDMNGKQHSLRQFRGKKVLLLTWASW